MQSSGRARLVDQAPSVPAGTVASTVRATLAPPRARERTWSESRRDTPWPGSLRVAERTRGLFIPPPRKLIVPTNSVSEPIGAIRRGILTSDRTTQRTEITTEGHQLRLRVAWASKIHLTAHALSKPRPNSDGTGLREAAGPQSCAEGCYVICEFVQTRISPTVAKDIHILDAFFDSCPVASNDATSFWT